MFPNKKTTKNRKRKSKGGSQDDKDGTSPHTGQKKAKLNRRGRKTFEEE